MARTNIRVSAIIFRDDKILLIRRRKPGKEYWILPGGAVEDFETVEEGLIREVKEETNLDVVSYKLAFSVPVSYEGSFEVRQPFYYCKVSDGVAEIIGEEKEINNDSNSYYLEWIKISELENYNLLPSEAKELLIKSDLEKFDKL